MNSDTPITTTIETPVRRTRYAVICPPLPLDQGRQTGATSDRLHHAVVLPPQSHRPLARHAGQHRRPALTAMLLAWPGTVIELHFGCEARGHRTAVIIAGLSLMLAASRCTG